jgi:predicted ester cyclase
MNARAQADEVVHALLDAWNARDLDGFSAQLTDDVYWHDLGMMHPPAVGRAAVRQFAETTLRAFPDFQYDMRGPICLAADGNSCMVPWTISATHTGQLDPPGLAPTGRRVRFDGLDYLVLSHGRVARIETRFDPAEPIEQLLGVRLRPGAATWQERSLVLLQRLVAAWIRARDRRLPRTAA